MNNCIYCGQPNPELSVTATDGIHCWHKACHPLPERCAIFNATQTHRYTLYRHIRPAGKIRPFDGDTVTFIGLNPSTATETIDDPTIRRCKRFAADWGFKQMWMTNIFAYRSTDPYRLMTATDPVGQYNDFFILHCCQRSQLVVAAWGNHGIYQNRAAAVKRLLADNNVTIRAFQVTSKGQPKHPLYMRADAVPKRFE